MAVVQLHKTGRIGLRRLDQKPVVLSRLRHSAPRVSILVTVTRERKLCRLDRFMKIDTEQPASGLENEVASCNERQDADGRAERPVRL